MRPPTALCVCGPFLFVNDTKPWSFRMTNAERALPTGEKEYHRTRLKGKKRSSRNDPIAPSQYLLFAQSYFQQIRKGQGAIDASNQC